MQTCQYLQLSSVKHDVWNIQIKSSPEAERFPSAESSSSLQQAVSASWPWMLPAELLELEGPRQGFGVWVGLGMRCTGVGDKFCVLKRMLLFLAGNGKIPHDDFAKLAFWLEIWKLGSGTSSLFAVKKKKRANISYENIIWKILFGISIRYSLGEM